MTKNKLIQEISFSGDSLKLNETFISCQVEKDKRIYHFNKIKIERNNQKIKPFSTLANIEKNAGCHQDDQSNLNQKN